MSNKKMNDSAKLRFTYGIILLVISGLLFAGFVCSIWLIVIVNEDFILLTLLSLLFFTITILTSISKFIEACQHMT